MLKDSLSNGITIISVEEMVAIKGEDKILVCEFCNRPVQFEIAMEVNGQKTYAWLCGKCPKSKTILAAPKGGGEC